MSNDKLISPTNIADSALFYSTGEMSLVIRIFGQGLGDLSPPLSSCDALILVSLIGFCADAYARLDGDISCPSCWSCDITLTEKGQVKEDLIGPCNEIKNRFLFLLYNLNFFSCLFPPFNLLSFSYPKSTLPVFLFTNIHTSCIV